MDSDKLKEIIELFANSLWAIGRAISYDEQNKSQAINRINESENALNEIYKIIRQQR